MFDVINYVIVKLFIIEGCTVSKIIYDVPAYLLFLQSIHLIWFHWRLSIDSRWVMCLYKWPRTLHSCGWSLYKWQTTRNQKPRLRLILTLIHSCEVGKSSTSLPGWGYGRACWPQPGGR